MPIIHPSSVVDPKAELADDVQVGPFCMIAAGVTLGKGCVLGSHVTILGGTTAGERNVFAQGAVIGGDPQDSKYHGESTYLRIGNDNVFREYVTVNRATGAELATVVGDKCFVMAYCHLGHNVTLENNVTVTNSTGLAGHVTVEESAYIGGMVGVHQFVRIGKASMVGGYSKIVRDVPPFMLVDGNEDEVVRDINAVGLRRRGIEPEHRQALHKACKLLYKSQLSLSNAMEIVRREVPLTEEVLYLLAFEERRYRGKNGRGDQP